MVRIANFSHLEFSSFSALKFTEELLKISLKFTEKSHFEKLKISFAQSDLFPTKILTLRQSKQLVFFAAHQWFIRLFFSDMSDP